LRFLPARARRWRYRVGDYRVIADIRDQTVTVLVVRIGHRGEVYRS
jgi:mRNA interferase RelE/StbE